MFSLLRPLVSVGLYPVISSNRVANISGRLMICSVLLGVLGLGAAAVAEVRSSASYAIEAESIDSSFEKTSTSANYSVAATVNFLGGTATEGGTSTVVRNGFKGALYEIKEVTVSATPGTVNEGESRQLTAGVTMDDDTTLALSPGDFQWSESSQWLSGISALGLASAVTVYQNEIANVNGTYAGVSDPDGFDLSILNVSADDFGSYGADGITDLWQVTYC